MNEETENQLIETVEVTAKTVNSAVETIASLFELVKHQDQRITELEAKENVGSLGAKY
jgi:hypothetical protein